MCTVLLYCVLTVCKCVLYCCTVYCLCVNVYCTAATGCQSNCSLQIYHISYLNFGSADFKARISDVCLWSSLNRCVSKVHCPYVQRWTTPVFTNKFLHKSDLIRRTDFELRATDSRSGCSVPNRTTAYGVESKSMYGLLFLVPIILMTDRQSLALKERERRQVSTLQHNFR